MIYQSPKMYSRNPSFENGVLNHKNSFRSLWKHMNITQEFIPKESNDGSIECVVDITSILELSFLCSNMIVIPEEKGKIVLEGTSWWKEGLNTYSIKGSTVLEHHDWASFIGIMKKYDELKED